MSNKQDQQDPNISVSIVEPEKKQYQQQFQSVLETTNIETNNNYSQNALNQDTQIYNLSQPTYIDNSIIQQGRSVTNINQSINSNQQFLITQQDTSMEYLTQRKERFHRYRFSNTSSVNRAMHSLSTNNLKSQIDGQEFFSNRIAHASIHQRQDSSNHLSPKRSLPQIDVLRRASQLAFKDKEKRKQKVIEEINECKKDNGYVKKMIDTFYSAPFDEINRELVGHGVSKQYYKNFKKTNRILQENEFHKVESSALTEMSVQAQKKRVMPSKMGLVKDTSSTIRVRPDKINLGHMSYGDDYISVLGSAIKKVDGVKSFSLNGNRIQGEGSQNLLPFIVYKAEKIKLQNNKIGKIGTDHLCAALENPRCRIKYLNLEDNQLGNTNITRIIDSLGVTKKLEILNISKNFITDQIQVPLNNLLADNNSNIKELYLHWNNLTALTGKILFECITKSTTVEVLDVSNNSLGSAIMPENKCVEALCEMLENNNSILHLDLSFNNFDYQDTKLISVSLEKNHDIYGFHFAGNSGYVDSRQFLVPEEVMQDVSCLVKKRKINGLKTVTDNTKREEREDNIRDICWICEGWKEEKFVYRPSVGGTKIQDPVFIHFNFENYKSCYFGSQSNMEEIVYKRMVPPGELNYFFSYMDEEQQANAFVNKENPKEIKKNNSKDNVLENVQFLDRVLEFKLKEINKREVLQDKEIIKNSVVQIKSEPRKRDEEYVPAKIKRKKIKWTFPRSLMAKWIPDNEEILSLCFEYDWECGKIQKIVKDKEQLEEIKDFFREKYQFIKDTYKHYASFNPVGDIWAIQNLYFVELINKLNIVDSKVTPADINIKWTSVLQGGKGVNIIPASQIMNSKPRASFKFLSENQSEQSPKNEMSESINNQMSPQFGNTLTVDMGNTVNLGKGRPSINFLPQDLQVKVNEGSTLKSLTQLTDPNSVLGGKNHRNPQQGMNRFQMMDMIVRLAEEKYINKYKLTKNYFEAVECIWNEHLQQELVIHNLQEWRNDRYWNEECDTVLKHYKRTIDTVYRDFSKKHVKPGQIPFMHIEELQTICQQMELDTLEHWSSTEHYFAYNLSMMTQVDELCSDRIFQMSVVEFYEAVARLAEKACFLPLEGVPGIEKMDEEAEWPLQKRKNLKLAYKMEGFIIKMLQKCTTPAFRSSQPKYDVSVFWVDPEESECEMVDA